MEQQKNLTIVYDKANALKLGAVLDFIAKGDWIGLRFPSEHSEDARRSSHYLQSQVNRPDREGYDPGKPYLVIDRDEAYLMLDVLQRTNYHTGGTWERQRVARDVRSRLENAIDRRDRLAREWFKREHSAKHEQHER